MKRKYIRRKPTRYSLAQRVGKLIGISPDRLKSGYLTRKDWMELLTTIERYQEQIRELPNESEATGII